MAIKTHDNSKEPPLTYALDISGKMVHILSVKRGLSCNCRCPKCNELLIARPGYGGRLPHFAHQGGFNCKGSYMSALHKLAEQIIEEEKAVMVPAYKDILKHKLLFEQVEVEKRVDRKDLQPDIVGITSDGLSWSIEIRNTHEVKEDKRNKLKESKITCLEIDVREQTLENLKLFLLESVEKREWINNPNYEFQIENEKRKKVALIEKLLFEKQEFVIPDYGKYEMKKVHFEHISVLYKSENGLFVKIKANSTEGIPYIFNIGSQNILDSKEYTLKVEPDCNELAINADSVYSDTVIRSCFLDTKWLYHYLTEKEHEAKIREYKSNPQYEVKTLADCNSRCLYQPFYGQCIYSKEQISYHGIDYMICDRNKMQKDQSITSHNNQGNRRLSRNIEKLSADNTYQEDIVVNTNCAKPSRINSPALQCSLDNPLPESLPFNRFWTIEEYYEQLLSSSSYKTDKGLFADIIEIEKTTNELLLLYKDPNEIRTYCPYHIVIISAQRGDITRNLVADFTNKSSATKSFYERLKAMTSSTDSRRTTVIDNSDLPF